MSITYNDLIARAQQVRDESEVGANTATRVGQLLTDIIQWCQDNNADLGDYLLNFTAHLNERGGILNWFQSRIVLLKTMGSGYDDVSVGSLSDGDVYYDSQGNWIFVKSGSSAINGIHPSEGVFYVNLANNTAYQWDGASFQVAIESGSGGGASTVTAFEGYEVIESVAELPEQGNPTTGYIVGTHIYAYVGENGDTADGAYQDLGELAAAGVSVTTNGDGTFTIHAGGNDYTVNLNHTHPNMCKLVVCEESGLPSTLDNSTIYAITDIGETEIEKLIIRGMEFAGGGVPDTGEPIIKTPADGATINLGTFDDLQSTPTKTITVWGKNLINGLTLEITANSGFSLSKSTLTKNEALAGEPVTISFDPSVLTTTTTTTEAALAIKDSVTNDILSVCTVSVTFLDERITLNKAISIDGNSYKVVNPSGFCTIKVAVTEGHTYKLHYGFVANQTDEDFIALGYDANNSPVLAARFRYSYGGNTNKYRNAALGTTTTTTLEVTMKTSALDECYIYDTNSNEYLFRGSNADQSLDT